MIYNIFLLLLVTGIGVFFFLKAMELSSEKEEHSPELIEKFVQYEINRNKNYEKKIGLEYRGRINVRNNIINIDSHPNFCNSDHNFLKKRA